jgi:hypothetical protein
MFSLAQSVLGKSTRAIERPPDDYEFNFPREYAVSTWHQYRVHGVLPEAGGWNDQPSRLVEDDWGYLNWWYNYALEQVSDDDNEQPQDDETMRGLINSMAGTSMGWDELTRG